MTRLREYVNVSPEYESLRDWGRQRLPFTGTNDPRASNPAATSAADASYGDEEVDVTEEEEAFEVDNETPNHPPPPFAQAFASMVQHGVLLGPHHATSLPADLLPSAQQHHDLQHPLLGPYPASMGVAPVYSHPQTQSASLSRQPPLMVSGYSPGGPSTASYASVSPLGMNGTNAASAGHTQTAPQGASTASTSSRPPQYGDRPPSA